MQTGEALLAATPEVPLDDRNTASNDSKVAVADSSLPQRDHVIDAVQLEVVKQQLNEQAAIFAQLRAGVCIGFTVERAGSNVCTIAGRCLHWFSLVSLAFCEVQLEKSCNAFKA